MTTDSKFLPSEVEQANLREKRMAAIALYFFVAHLIKTQPAVGAAARLLTRPVVEKASLEFYPDSETKVGAILDEIAAVFGVELPK